MTPNLRQVSFSVLKNKTKGKNKFSPPGVDLTIFDQLPPKQKRFVVEWESNPL